VVQQNVQGQTHRVDRAVSQKRRGQPPRKSASHLAQNSLKQKENPASMAAPGVPPFNFSRDSKQQTKRKQAQ
jgi:hypothetical protein